MRAGVREVGAAAAATIPRINVGRTKTIRPGENNLGSGPIISEGSRPFR